MTEKRGAWYLLTGVIIGLLVGIIFSLWIVPVQYVNTDPSSLREKDRQTYRVMVAQAYLVEGDVNRALTRLALLQDKNVSELIISQAQKMLADGGSEAQARALALLAAAVNEPSLSVTPLPPLTPAAVQVTELTITPSSQETSVNPDVTNTPGPTSTPRPTSMPLATAGPPYVLEDDPLPQCDALSAKPLLQITVLDGAGQPVPGVKIEITQSGGNPETFFTGLYPEISRGYADYEMLPGILYTIRVGETGQPVPDLTAPTCNDGNGDTTYGNLWLVFSQP